MSLSESSKKNFVALKEAMAKGRAILIELEKKGSDQTATAIAVIDDEGFFTPLVTLIEGNPFETFNPPDLDENAWAPNQD